MRDGLRQDVIADSGVEHWAALSNGNQAAHTAPKAQELTSEWLAWPTIDVASTDGDPMWLVSFAADSPPATKQLERDRLRDPRLLHFETACLAAGELRNLACAQGKSASWETVLRATWRDCGALAGFRFPFLTE